MKQFSAGAVLKNYFLDSLALSRQITRAEHRANPFVNILNISSKTAKQYPDLLQDKTLQWRFFHSCVGAAVNLLRSIRYAPHRIRLRPPTQEMDVLVISHLIDKSHLDKETDFYFGNLGDVFEETNIKAHIVLINHCHADSRHLSMLNQTKKTVLPAFYSPSHEIKHIGRLLLASMTLPKDRDKSVNKNFLRLARVAQFGGRAIGDFRIGKMIAEFIEVTQPRIVIHTYEGHGWEKIATSAAHSLPNRAHVIGYQHAVLSPGDKSIFHNHGGETAPDHIFTTGEFTRNELQKNMLFLKHHITAVGTFKNVTNRSGYTFKPNGTCLFAPEGTLDEIEILTRVAVNAARLDPTRKFVLRLHPVINSLQAQKIFSRFMPFSANFIVSARTLDEDIKAASWICYRGSSVSLQGILAGLRPIFIGSDSDEYQNNPIPRDIAYLRVSRDANELISILRRDKKCPMLARQELVEARNFANQYFMPFKQKVIINHINRHMK